MSYAFPEFWTAAIRDGMSFEKFIWTYDDPKITWYNWFYKDPNNFDGHENCLGTKLHGGQARWNDSPCEEKKCVVCEK